jgi:hypothetical protein
VAGSHRHYTELLSNSEQKIQHPKNRDRQKDRGKKKTTTTTTTTEEQS